MHDLKAADYYSDARSNSSNKSDSSSVQDLVDAFEDENIIAEKSSKKIKTEIQPMKEDRQKWDAQSLKQYASSNIFIYYANFNF